MSSLVAIVPATSSGAALDPHGLSLTPSPNVGSLDNYLSNVACPSVRFCVAVGGRSAGAVDWTLAEEWNGHAWSHAPSPNVGKYDDLDDVACPSMKMCFAVGVASNGSVDRTLVLRWNGRAWSVVASPNAGSSSNILEGVSCASMQICFAVGYTNSTSGSRMLTERWNGRAWRIVASPDVGSNYNYFNAVSCPSPTFCVAAGYANPITTNNVTVIERWNGRAWILMPSPNVGTANNYLNGVSCPSAQFCMVVGNAGNGSTAATLAERWSGHGWSVVATPVTSPGYDELRGASCLGPAFCIAVGSRYPSGMYRRTLFERWNGKRWYIEASPNTGSLDNQLNGACFIPATSSTVQAVGYRTVGVDRTLVISGH